MRQSPIRFVGGSQHGKLRAVQYDHERCVFPLYDHTRVVDQRDYVPYAPMFKEELYERRPLGLGMYAKVYVMALASMGEAEFMRRVADIIEGV